MLSELYLKKKKSETVANLTFAHFSSLIPGILVLFMSLTCRPRPPAPWAGPLTALRIPCSGLPIYTVLPEDSYPVFPPCPHLENS